MKCLPSTTFARLERTIGLSCPKPIFATLNLLIQLIYHYVSLIFFLISYYLISLTEPTAHCSIVEKMDSVKTMLLQKHYNGIDPSKVHSGYHRGHRPVWGSLGYPDIISVHHLHLHVIVEPEYKAGLLKYPKWFPLMWMSDDELLEQVRSRTPVSTT
jgi:hypothetical protein